MSSVFEEIDRLFAQKMRDAVAEVSAEEPRYQDWGRIERMSHQYGGFLELFPEAIPAKAEPEKPPAKKAVAKKAAMAKAPVKKK